ncbi:hypothetical protein ACHAWF_013168 [Thalassiosira exigua]
MKSRKKSPQPVATATATHEDGVVRRGVDSAPSHAIECAPALGWDGPHLLHQKHHHLPYFFPFPNHINRPYRTNYTTTTKPYQPATRIQTMGLTDFALRRLAPAAGATALATWTGMTTLNDDWDDYFRPSGKSDGGEPEPEKIVILGSGWAALNALRKCASPTKSVVVVSPRPHFLYTPLLASSSVGTITLRSACEPLRALVESAASRAAGATFVRAYARDVDVEGKRVWATTDSDGTELELAYDKLVVAVGSVPNDFGTPGVKDHALFLKEAEDSAKLHAKLLSNLEKAAALSLQGEKYRAEIDRLLKVVVVGGGPTGVELSAELADFAHNDVARRYGADIASRIQIILVEAMPRILAPFDETLAKVARDHLVSKGVDVRTGTAVTYVEAQDVTLAPSTPRNATPEQKAAAAAAAESEEMGALVWAAGTGPDRW